MEINKKSRITQLKFPLLNMILDFLTIRKIAEFKKCVKNKKILLSGNFVIKSKMDINYCRFCLCRKRYDQIIRPCECTGKTQFVHEDCFRKYIEKNLCYEIHEDFSDDKVDLINCQYCNTKIAIVKRNKNYFLITFLRILANLLKSLDNLFFFQCTMYCLILLVKKAIRIIKQIINNIKNLRSWQFFSICYNLIHLASIIFFFLKMIDLTSILIHKNLYKKIKVKRIFNKEELQPQKSNYF